MEKTQLIGLIQKAASGDSSAFSVLYEEYYNKIYYLCFKLLQNREDASDITQETFVNAYQNLNTLNNALAFESWLKTIAANKCRNYLKKHKPVLFSQYKNENIAQFIIEDDKAENAEEIVDNSEIHRIINEIVDHLPYEQRRCVILYYYDEKSVAEIAELLECSEGTVKSRLNYARKKIRNELEAIEKRDNIQLHSAEVIPLLGLILSGQISHTVSHPPFSYIADSAAEAADYFTDSAFQKSAKAAKNLSDGISSSVKKSVFNNIFKTTASKAIAGVLCATVLVSAGAFAGSRLNNELNKPVSNTTINSTEKTTVSTTEATTQIKAENIAGNTSGNLNNCGYAALYGDWIYYCDTWNDDSSSLYRIKNDGSGKEKISDHCDMLCPFINVVDDYVYYIGQDGIYAIRTDGSDKHKICNDFAYYMCVVGDMIYYSVSESIESNKSYSMKIDGSNREKLVDGDIIAVADNYIYYHNQNDEYKIYSVKTDGSDNHKIIDSSTYNINVIGGWIYYSNESDGNRIYAVKNDGSENHKISDDAVYDFNVTENKIYYSNNDDSQKLYSMNLDGSDNKKLNDDMLTDSISIAGNYIYCQINPETQGGPNYRMSLDGSNKERI